MAEPLKNSFGRAIPRRIGEMISAASRRFDQKRFLAAALDGYDELELTPRARQISNALAGTLPPNREKAIGILIESLNHISTKETSTAMGSFLYLPLVFFVADHGLDCFETSMRAQYELTQRFTAEFSIRAFLDRYPERTLSRLRTWTRDPSVHVRRLVSEGTRPRLPWAPRLRRFIDDPAPVIQLLELLKDDPEEYVRRSVANNLNDISKDHPGTVIALARRWWKSPHTHRRRLVRHGLRTLIKRTDPGALAVLGYQAATPVIVCRISCKPPRLKIGGKVRVEVEIQNRSSSEARALLDLRVHFVKATGATAPRVFKGGEAALQAGERTTIGKTISVAQHSTRTHHPGLHPIEILLNGTTHKGTHFVLT